MPNNILYCPLINPVKFYEVGLAFPDKYQTKHFDDFGFKDRLYPWQQPEEEVRIWQTTDIVYIQVTANFSPVVLELVDMDDNPLIQLPANITLANIYVDGAYIYQFSMSLAGLATGCYRFRIIAGPDGEFQKVYRSDKHFISAEPIANTMLIEYQDGKDYHQDVLFVTGIKFQMRMFASFNFLDPGRDDEYMRDQRNNGLLLSSFTKRQWPVQFGNEFGCTDDEIDLLNRIWSCSNVELDNKLFGVTDDSKFEFTAVDEMYYPKRGVRLLVEEGINRNSSVFSLTLDTTKKIISVINVDNKVFGDMANSGSANTVPVHNITVE